MVIKVAPKVFIKPDTSPDPGRKFFITSFDFETPWKPANMSAYDEYSNGNPGGFINPRHGTPRQQKIKWTPINDRKLLLVGLGREISPQNYSKIVTLFSEKPTPKSIQERLAKLRQEAKVVLRSIGIATEPEAEMHNAPDDFEFDEDDEEVSELDTPEVKKQKTDNLFNMMDTIGSGSEHEADTDAANVLMGMNRSGIGSTPSGSNDASSINSFATPQPPSKKRKRETSTGTSTPFGNSDSLGSPPLTGPDAPITCPPPRIHKSNYKGYVAPKRESSKKKQKTKSSAGEDLIPAEIMKKAKEQLREQERQKKHIAKQRALFDAQKRDEAEQAAKEKAEREMQGQQASTSTSSIDESTMIAAEDITRMSGAHDPIIQTTEGTGAPAASKQADKKDDMLPFGHFTGFK